MGFTKNLIFQGGAYRELRQFVDLREELEEKRVWCFSAGLIPNSHYETY